MVGVMIVKLLTIMTITLLMTMITIMMTVMIMTIVRRVVMCTDDSEETGSCFFDYALNNKMLGTFTGDASFRVNAV